MSVFTRWLLGFLVAIALGIVATGTWFHRAQQDHVLQGIEQDLEAIARLKADEIAHWRGERLADAAALSESPFFSQEAAEWIATPRAEVTERLLAEFRSLQQRYGYGDVLLVGLDSEVRLSLGGRHGSLHDAASRSLAAALRDGKPQLTDLNKRESDASPQLAAVGPIFAGTGPDRNAVGAVVLVIDASRFLYPLVQSWPAPSESAETLLVQRDGDAVLFLNDLRHNPGAALKLRIPMTQTGVPAVMAAMGRTGVVHGVDYRGVPVVSVLRAIPDSPWLMVGKMDKREVFAAWRFRSALIFSLILGLLGVLGVAAGATWHRRGKEHYRALCESETRYRRLFEAAKDGILILDAGTGQIVDVNPFLVELLGFAREDFLGKHLWEIGPFKDKAACKMSFAELQAREYVRYEDLPLETRGGQKIAVEFVSNVYIVDGQKVIQCNIRNITDHKKVTEENRRLLEQSDRDRVGLLGILEDANRAAEALRRNTAFLNSLLEAMPVPVFYKDVEGRYLGVNPAFEAFLGQPHEAFVGKTVFDIAPRELAEIHQTRDSELFRNPGVQVYEAKMKNARGRICDVVYHKATFTDANGKVVGLVGAILDLTERRQAEEEREQMRAQLLHSQRLEAIGTLASGVAHEINNPINGIMNYARLIADRIEANSPLREYATEIMKETDRVALIVQNLLTFSRREKQSHSPARLIDIVEATLSLIRTIIRHDEIVLEVDVPEDLPSIRCRSQQIQQVLMNLLTNARDALNERYPGAHDDKVIRVTARTEDRGQKTEVPPSPKRYGGQAGVQGSGQEGEKAGDVGDTDSGSLEGASPRWVRITVEDHGAGIPPELRGRIFDPFFSTKPRDKGTGLGLAISHGIVKDHDGRLTVESEVGRYTRMHVDLPV